MVVEQRQCRVTRKLAESTMRQYGVFIRESHFNVISDPENNKDDGSDNLVPTRPTNSVLAHNPHKANYSKQVPSRIITLDVSKHSTIIIGENSDPNIQQPLESVYDPPNVQKYLLEKPPDILQVFGSTPPISDPPLDQRIHIGFNAVTNDNNHDLSGDQAMDMLK
ncbi:hypothetical protein V6N13_110874 [Hibiscus sabdariffa]|uniref:Uncharacterized protein n=1 Tax=Hibiscus sabdariffa TaxID=183260 RepID=A0ABR2TJ70_9ROSI